MLTTPILSVVTIRGTEPATLPDALAWLCDGSLLEFDGLAAHQRQAWDQFLWQAAALALIHSGDAEAAEDEAAWRALSDPVAWRRRLEALTPGHADTAWSLVVPDLTKPAFLQPPIPSGRLDGYGVAGQTPDEIDVLVTSKMHDVKAARAGAAALRHWLFALVTLQTTQGYSGRGNFGIVRMNGGFGSRPLVMLTPARDRATQFRRGVRIALKGRRDALAGSQGYYRDGGVALAWLLPWDRSLADLDPLFIEVCRRIRLTADGAGRITAMARPSDGPRVAASKEAKGMFGDPWTPVTAESSLTVGGTGFDYKLLNRLLTAGEFKMPASMELLPGDPHDMMWLRATVLVRGQGKTEGLHERWLRVPTPFASRRDPELAERLGRIGRSMVTDAEGARKALRFGLLNFIQGGGDAVDFKDERPAEWLERLEQQVDAIFFDHLFAQASADDAARSEANWRRVLAGLTRQLFFDGVERLSPPGQRREKARAVANRTFGVQLAKAKLTTSRDEKEEAA